MNIISHDFIKTHRSFRKYVYLILNAIYPTLKQYCLYKQRMAYSSDYAIITSPQLTLDEQIYIVWG